MYFDGKGNRIAVRVEIKGSSATSAIVDTHYHVLEKRKKDWRAGAAELGNVKDFGPRLIKAQRY